MAETVVYTPEQSGSSVPAWLPYLNNGGFGSGLGGWGGGILGFLLGLFFGNGGWGGFGGFSGNWGGGNAGAGFLSNQINNDSGRELLMNAITSQGEASRTAIGNLSTMLGQDFNLVNNTGRPIYYLNVSPHEATEWMPDILGSKVLMPGEVAHVTFAPTPGKMWDLMAVFDRSDWLPINKRWIAFGREICDAKRPRCQECFLADICPSCKRES